MQFFLLNVVFFVPTAGIQRNVVTRGRNTTMSVSDCIDMTVHTTGTFVTVPIEIGSVPRTVNAIVDVSSRLLLVQESFASNSTIKSGFKGILEYSGGKVMVEKAKDWVKIGSTNTSKEGIYLMEQYSNKSGFGEVEAILPLSPDKQSYLHSPTFSISLGERKGAMHLGGTGPTPVNASKRWMFRVFGMTVGNESTRFDYARMMVDTGTTYILGPLQDIKTLCHDACFNWSRCDKYYSGGPALAFVEAVEKYGCGNEILPNITFDLGTDHITLTGSSYTFLQDGKCVSAFEYFEYWHLWIVGLPVFYQYTVNFDAKHHKIGFGHESSPSCTTSIMERPTVRQIRHLYGPGRWPTEYPDEIEETPDTKSTKAHLPSNHVPLKERLMEDQRKNSGHL